MNFRSDVWSETRCNESDGVGSGVVHSVLE